MASSIVDELFDRLIHTFPPDRSYGPGDVSTHPMPGPVAHFLDQLLQRRLDLEMRNMREATSAWVDADHADVQEAARAFRTALRPHLHVPADEWERVLRRAVQRVTAYLIHPTQTMTDFAFGSEDRERPVPTIRERIHFFAPYPYLREAVDAFIEREGTDTLRRTAFEAMLQRADEQTIADYTTDDWLRLLEPLFNLMELTSLRGVPVSFLQTFFQSKGASAVVKRLQAASLEQGTMALDRTDLRQLLTGNAARRTAPTAASAQSPNASPSSQAPSPEAAPSSSSQPAPEPDPSSAESNGPTPLWKQFQGAGGLSADASPSKAPEPAPDAPDGAPLWQRFRPAGASATPAPNESAPAESPSASPAEPPTGKLASLERAVLGSRGPSNRERFVRELFNGAQEDYRRTLQRLREAPNWTRASQIIAQDVFRANQVNIYSEPAVLFTNAVEDRFRQRS